MNELIAVIGVSAIVSIATCFAIFCGNDALGIGLDIGKKYKTIKLAPDGESTSYTFDRDDFERGICEESEIGTVTDHEALKKRCEAAEKANPLRFRRGRFAEN